MTPILTRSLGHLLWLANTRPSPDRAAFYALKTQLLHRFGTLIGEDVQQITALCWACDGTGICLGRCCFKCGGSGVFERYHVTLERWELGGHVLHCCPIRRFRGHQDVTIHGYVRHPQLGWRASVAKLLLFALFDSEQVYESVERWKRGVNWWRNHDDRKPRLRSVASGFSYNDDEIPF